VLNKEDDRIDRLLFITLFAFTSIDRSSFVDAFNDVILDRVELLTWEYL
jgi:hypothetical protein